MVHTLFTELSRATLLSLAIVLKFIYAFDIEDELVEFDERVEEVGLARY